MRKHAKKKDVPKILNEGIVPTKESMGWNNRLSAKEELEIYERRAKGEGFDDSIVEIDKDILKMYRRTI